MTYRAFVSSIRIRLTRRVREIKVWLEKLTWKFSEKTKDSVDDFNADFKTFLAMINDFSTQADAMGKFFVKKLKKKTILKVIIQKEFRAK